ncbi:MAG: DUF1343 domain-containing protein [Bacteroidia bacterium]
MEQMDMLAGKRIGIVANHTSRLFDGVHLVDTLLAAGVDVKLVFAPEHGFRGTADAGAAIASGTDARTGLPIISLYGKNKKPTPEQMAQVDLILFDIQDVGSRHYTYISTMTYVMEACAESGKPIAVLDRPNPNGWYVDGPVLEAAYSSFIGMHPVPIVHGMSIGEYARMVNEEGWLEGGRKADLTVITCKGYRHDMRWEETGLTWIPPSPNLATAYAAYLYPALCWFEATPVSVGRGTEEAFTIVGAPWYETGIAAREADGGIGQFGIGATAYTFTPVSLPGKSTQPPYQDELCHGWKFSGEAPGKQLLMMGVSLMSDLYRQHRQARPKNDFFFKGFERWPGNTELRRQIEAGATPEAIWQSWQPAVARFRDLRAAYLLYP